MAESSWPGEAPTTVTEAAYERLSSAWFGSGLVGDVSDDSLVFADSTGLHVKLRAERYARVRGFTWYSGESDVQLAVSANSSGSTRVDRVVLRLDRSDWTVRAVVLEGTPGGGAPDLTTDVGDTGEWELCVADVTIPDGTTSTITAGMVESRDNFLGGQLLVTKGPTALSPNVPEISLRYRSDEDRLILMRDHANTSGQVDLWSDSGEVALASSNSNWEHTTDAVIRRIGQVVHLRYGSVQRTAGHTLSTGDDSTLPGVIPSTMRHPNRDQYATVRITGHEAGRVTIIRDDASSNAGRIRLTSHGGVGTGQFIMGFTVSWFVP